MANFDQKSFNMRQRNCSQIFDKIKEGVVIMSLDGIILDMNQAVEKITGYTREEGIMRSWRDFALDDVIGPILEMFHQNRLLSDISKISEFKFLNKSGEYIPIECSVDFLKDKDGTGDYVLLFIRDIKKQKTFEQKLEKTIDELNMVSELLPICANCKKIRDDEGYWSQVDTYFQKHKDIKFSHGICPKCAEELYGDLLKD